MAREQLMAPIDEVGMKSMRDYRKLIYTRIYQQALKEGLLRVLEIPHTVEEVQEQMSFKPSRLETLNALLNVLTAIGVVRAYFNPNAQRVFCATRERMPDYLLEAPTTNTSQLSTGTMTTTHADVPELTFRCLHGEDVDVRFDEASKEYWKSVLEAPFYARGREIAADEIAFEGGCVLDLASGQGHGLKRLARNVGPGGEVVGLELSDYHVQVSRKETKDLKNVRIVQANLDNGLEVLEDGKYDGAMIIGAFHFLRKKEKFVENVSRALKPKAKLVIGNVYLDADTFDRPYLDMMFSITNPEARATPTRPVALEYMLKEQGFQVYFSYHVGSFGWYFGSRNGKGEMGR